MQTPMRFREGQPVLSRVGEPEPQSILDSFPFSNSLVPTELIVPKDAVSIIQRRLFLRNESTHDMLIKLVGSNSDVIQFDHDKIKLSPGVCLQIWVQINCQKIKKGSVHKISAYATRYHPYNMRLNDWLKTPGAEKPRQLAFELALRVCGEYSAQDIIVDMPGLSCVSY